MRKTLLSATCAVFLLTGGVGAMGSRDAPPAATEAKTSLQLIAEARESGAIDEDTAVLYRVFSVVDESRLPPEYAGSRPMKDGTAVLRQARARFESLRPEVQEELRPYLFPRRP